MSDVFKDQKMTKNVHWHWHSRRNTISFSLSFSNYPIEECCWAKLIEYVVAIIRMHPSRNGFSLASARRSSVQSNVYLCDYELFLLSRWKWVPRDCWSKLLYLHRYGLSFQADTRCVTLNNKTFSQQSFGIVITHCSWLHFTLVVRRETIRQWSRKCEDSCFLENKRNLLCRHQVVRPASFFVAYSLSISNAKWHYQRRVPLILDDHDLDVKKRVRQQERERSWRQFI